MNQSVIKINDYIKARDVHASAIKTNNAISSFLELTSKDLTLDELKQLTAVRDFLGKYIWGTETNDKWASFIESLNNDNQSK